jgi:DNA-binding NarL/FixJ family response regulator
MSTPAAAPAAGPGRGRPRVLLVDDHSLFRSGVRAELGSRVEVIGEADDVAPAIELIGRLLPDVVLLDVHLPGGGGHAVITAVKQEHPEVKFLALSASDAPEDVIAVIRAGARGYVTKTISTADLADAIRRVADGDAVFSHRLAGFVLDAFASAPAPDDVKPSFDPELDQLTTREREVLRLIAQGYTYKEIARDLFISGKTVESHVSSVLRKLQLSSRHQLTRWATERRLALSPGRHLPAEPVLPPGRVRLAGFGPPDTPDAVAVGQLGQPGGDLAAVLVVAGADGVDQRHGVRPDMAAPGAGRGDGRGHRRRFDGEDPRHVTLEQRAERHVGAADVKGADLLQVEEPLGLRRGDHAPGQIPGRAGEPARVGRAVAVQRRHDVGRARAGRAPPRAQLIAAQRGERAAVQLQLALGPQVLLEEPRVLRPAELVERAEDDLPDRRPRLRGPQSGAGGPAELVDQLLAALVKPAEHGGLGDQLRDRNVGVARVFSKSAGELQGFLKRGGEIITDGSQAHGEDCTRIHAGYPWAPCGWRMDNWVPQEHMVLREPKSTGEHA